MSASPAPFYRTASVWLAILLVVAAMFGTSRDFGLFLVSLLVLPCLALLFLGCLAIELARAAPVGHALTAIGIALLSPFAYSGPHAFLDPCRVLILAARHPDVLRDAMHRDGVVRLLDSWGWGGMQNSSYLVVDRTDRINAAAAAAWSVPTAAAWAQREGFFCEIVAEQRVWPRLYIVTARNCDVVEPS